MDTRDIGSLLLEAGRQLAARTPRLEAPRLEAELLLAHALETSRSFLYAHPEIVPPDSRCSRFRELVQRRMQGEPIAYLTGTREFWSLELEVSPAVLIPRPETETLVAAALERLPRSPSRVADLGTGSGAIALAIASERPAAEVHATELCPAALAVAQSNARRLKLERIHFHQGDWCQPLSGRFDLIASNPPYVAEGDPHLGTGDLRFEPRQALSPGGDGLAAIRIISKQALPLLRDAGWLLFEHGTDQGAAVRDILAAAGYRELRTLRDLEERERVTLGQRISRSGP